MRNAIRNPRNGEHNLMKALLSITLSVCIVATAFAQAANQQTETYPVHPDSQAQSGVPKGEVLKFSFSQSKIFPGTTRDYWVYVPAQYSPDKPACVYVNQDGLQYEGPTVFDNLIHKKEMPITIGVFVMPGRVKAEDPKTALDRFKANVLAQTAKAGQC